MRNLIIIPFTLLLISCTSQNKDMNNSGEQKADTIFITYFQHSVDSDVAITCDKIASIQKDHLENDYNSYFEYGMIPLVIDTFIVNSEYIEKIDSLLQLREKIETFNDDKRMLVSIKRHNGKNDELCIGNFLAPKVYYNNEPYIIADELIFILRYKSGYYRWNDPNLFQELNNHKEIKKELEEQLIVDDEFRKEKEKILLNQAIE
ncbi:hypothetical protein [uncultured Dysgonomonas sp.]|uniref:Lipoprotein n=1 Tax=uncultured Dysgonomonas sp. TaxID=206096 RepID=A0A212JFR8_9BACT|nr:hypothetical protein [uncultured Dysgonomonas sp.]SBV98278.1 exported hypothetical protein [uncultured Dysgonomonas sp.]